MKRRHSDRGASRPLLLLRSVSLVTITTLGFTGCESIGLSEPSMPGLSSVTSMFDKKQEKLPGRRVSVIKADEAGSVSGPEASGPIALPPAVTNVSWSQPGGVSTNAPGHLALSQDLHTVWTAEAGEGSSKRERLTAIPIVLGKRIFTLDAEGTVRAVSTQNGAVEWSFSTVPDAKSGFDFMHPFHTNNVARAGFGGGIAAEDGRLFVATGYGTVYALDMGTGQPVWTKRLDIPVREAPTAAGGRIFLVDSESQLYCLKATDGSQLWTQKGLPENAAVLTSASPAVSGDVVYVPYPSGEITAVDVKTGQPKWTDSLAKGQINSSATAIGEAARPVVDGNAVFAMSRGGQLIATSKDKGERLWTREIAGTQTPWVAGDSVFVVDVSGKLIALTRKDGKVRWVTSLPGNGRWSGPVLAGGKLWLASDEGLFVGADASTGAISTQSDLGEPVLITPVVAEGRLYVLTDKAKLIAMN